MVKGKDGLFFIFLIIAFLFAGCGGVGSHIAEIYPVSKLEADWIRNAEPIEFEAGLWYPVDDVENLLDNEVLPIATYRNVQFFVEKKDIRPFERLYTKFERHKYRVFERADKND